MVLAQSYTVNNNNNNNNNNNGSNNDNNHNNSNITTIKIMSLCLYYQLNENSPSHACFVIANFRWSLLIIQGNYILMDLCGSTNLCG